LVILWPQDAAGRGRVAGLLLVCAVLRAADREGEVQGAVLGLAASVLTTDLSSSLVEVERRGDAGAEVGVALVRVESSVSLRSS